MKVRETTKADSFTIPHSCDEKVEFFHGKPDSNDEPWDELHVVHQVTKVLLAVYSREQLYAMTSRSATRRARCKSGVIVNVLPI